MENIDVRMILCDVDGTLLKKGDYSISDEIFNVISNVVDRGVQFVIASGRCYPDLKTMFSPVIDKVSFICNDGALAVCDGNVAFNAVIHKERISSLYNSIPLSVHEGFVLYGKYKAYCMGNNPLQDVLETTEDMGCICEDIYKLAYYNLTPFHKQQIRSYVARGTFFSEIYTDSSWIEFVSRGIDKGVATATLQSLWNISPMETAAFGDNLNDIGMLRRARLSYAAPGAVLDVQRMCKFSTKDVAQEIAHVIL